MIQPYKFSPRSMPHDYVPSLQTPPKGRSKVKSGTIEVTDDRYFQFTGSATIVMLPVSYSLNYFDEFMIELVAVLCRNPAVVCVGSIINGPGNVEIKVDNHTVIAQIKQITEAWVILQCDVTPHDRHHFVFSRQQNNWSLGPSCWWDALWPYTCSILV